MVTQSISMPIRLPRANVCPDISEKARRSAWVDRLAPFHVMFVVILLSQSIEAFVARNVSFGLMGKMTLGFTVIAVLVSVGPAILFRLRTFLFTIWVNGMFQFYSLIALASTYWSIAPSETLKTALTLIGFHMTGTALASMYSWRAIWKGIAWGLLFLAFVGVLIIPHDGLADAVHVGAFRGLWLEKNATGEALGIGAIACVVVAIADRNPKYFLGVFFLLALIVFARAAGALATSVVAISFCVFVESIRRGPFRFFMGSWLACVVVVSVVVVIAAMGAEATSLIGRDTTLTGRTAIWPVVIDFIKQKPWFGYGFQAFWIEGSETMTRVEMRAQFEAFNAHNSFFELMLGFGLVGSVFVWGAVARSMWQSSTALYGGNDARRFALPFFIYGIALSMSESMLGDSAGMSAFVLGILVPRVALGNALAKGHFKG